jgi:hypothetical protein
MSIRSLCKLAFTMFAFSTLTVCQAQQNNFAGQWRGVYQGIVFNYVMDTNYNYSDHLVSGTMQTMESGKYHLSGQNLIIFQVLDWQPKTQNVYHPTGTVGGYYTQEVLAKPPGGTFSYVFNSPNSVTLTDVNLHGSVTLNRVQ